MTLASRMLGMVRDMAIASLLGLGGVMDAFALAFRLPNLFRRLLGEGALAASYLPVFTAHLERDPKTAWQLASVLLTRLAVLLTGLLLLIEAGCWWLGVSAGGDENLRLLAGLSAVMMPFMVFICLTAQLSATLHALKYFALPAFTPILLNITLLAGAWTLAPHYSGDQAKQAYVLAGCVLLAGVVQFITLIFPLRKAGFKYEYNLQAAKTGLGEVTAACLPMLFGLAVTQLNTLADSVIAWTLSAGANAQGLLPVIGWLPGEIRYPMADGAVSTIYYGERLYQFPLGILGVALATVTFPLFSRHAARGERALLGKDLTLALRLVVLWGVPASAGLWLFAEPIAALLFERGEFTAADTLRTAAVIRAYGIGVWAFCAVPVLVRAYYAVSKQKTPVWIGAGMCVANIGLNLVLIWPQAESGLALATTITSAGQVLLLLYLAPKQIGPIAWSDLLKTIFSSLIATGVMLLIGTFVASQFLAPFLSAAEPVDRNSFYLLWLLGAPMLACVFTYLTLVSLLPGRSDHRRLLWGKGLK